MGTPTILSSDVELTKTVYQQTNKLFDLALPSTTASILGKESLFFMKADIHKKVRNLIKVPFSVKELESFIPSIDRTCQNVTASWKNQEQIRVYHEAKKVITSLLVTKLPRITIPRIQINKEETRYLIQPKSKPQGSRN